MKNNWRGKPTEGKLRAEGTEIYRDDGTCLCSVDQVIPFELESEDARRLVACWNGFQDVPTEWIERYVVFGAKNILQENAALTKERDALKAEVESLRIEKDAAIKLWKRGRRTNIKVTP